MIVLSRLYETKIIIDYGKGKKMADSNKPENNDEEFNSDQQNLDDLTVLANVTAQNMGNARLNVARAADISDTSIGNLANIIPGNAGDRITFDTNTAFISPPKVVTEQVAPTEKIPEIESLDLNFDGGLAPIEVTATPLKVETIAAPEQIKADNQPAPIEEIKPTVVGTSVPVGTLSTSAISAVATQTPAQQVIVNEVTVADVNHAPVITNETDAVTANDHSSQTGRITANDPDGDTVSYYIVDSTSGTYVNSLVLDNGTVTINATTGEYTFTPNDNQTQLGVGETSGANFQVVAMDSNGAVSAPVGVDVTVTGSNDGPVTTSVILTDELEDNTILITASDLLSNASDVDGDTLSVSNLSASNGTITDNHDGTFTFTPNENFHGNVDLTYTISDGQGGTTAGTASFDVASVNDGPVTANISLGSGNEDNTILINATDLLANASDVDGDTLSISNLTATNGTIVDNQDGTYTFTPNSEFSGEVELNYTIDDGNGGSTPGLAMLDIAAINDAAIIGGTLEKHVSENSAKVTGKLTVQDVDSIARMEPMVAETPEGTFTLNGKGSWRFDVDKDAVQHLASGESITREFVVQSVDGTEQTVSVIIDGKNDIATISGDTMGNVGEEGGVTTGQLSVADLDHDQSYIREQTVVTNDGTFTVNSAGEWAFQVNPESSKVQGLSEGETLTKTFTVKSIDGSDSQKITVTITGDNDAATITGKTTGSISEDDASIALGTVKVADIDQGENHIQSQTISDEMGTFTIGTNGKWTFAANNNDPSIQSLGAGETITKTFTVVSADGSDSQDIAIKITGSNDGPIVSGPVDIGDVNEDTSFTFTRDQLLTNASDIDGDTLLISNLSSANGQLVENDDGTYTFTPDANFNGNVEVKYTVSDGNGGTTESTASFDVNSVNDGPTTSTVNLDGVEDTTITITYGQLLSQAGDVDGDALTVINLTTNNGALVDNHNGTWSFTPSADFNGTVNLSYQVSDGTTTATGGAVVNVGAINDSPVTTSFGYTMNEDGTLTIRTTDILSHSSDIDSASLSVTSLTTNAGTLVDNHDGTWNLTPARDFNGQINLSFTVSDGQLTSTNQIDVNVLPVAEETTPPSITNFVDADGDLKHVTMYGIGDVAGDTINVYDEDNRLVGTTTVDENHSWSLDVSSLKYTGNNDNEFFKATEVYSDGSVSNPSEVTHYWHGDWSNAETEASDDFALMGSGNDTVQINDNDQNDHVVIDGGDGTDKAIFDFKLTDADLAKNDDGSFTFTEANGDVNEIRNFENFQFSDKTYTAGDIDKIIEDLTVPPGGNSSGGSGGSGGGSHGGSHGGSSGGGNSWQNNGWGNGDQTAPGNSGENNNAENGTGSNSTEPVSYTYSSLSGGNGKDTLRGTDDNDWLSGGNGNDTLYASGGHDELYGDNGNDLFIWGADAGNGNGWDAIVNGGNGNDTADLTALNTGDWTFVVDGHDVDHSSHGTFDVSGKTVEIHSVDGDSTITFENIENLKF